MDGSTGLDQLGQLLETFAEVVREIGYVQSQERDSLDGIADQLDGIANRLQRIARQLSRSNS